MLWWLLILNSIQDFLSLSLSLFVSVSVSTSLPLCVSVSSGIMLKEACFDQACREACQGRLCLFQLGAVSSLSLTRSLPLSLPLSLPEWRYSARRRILGPSAQGGVTRQGVVLTYLLSFLVDSQ